MSIDDWWRSAIIYQIYPRSYADSNSDGVGDLPGITSKLDHIASLGVDAIWISPFFKSPMKDFGYDVSDFYDVDPLFGSLDDFDKLREKADSLDLKIMVDMVLNHTSDQHEWFKQSASSKDNDKSDWYVWADASADGTPPNNWISVFGGSSWQWHTTRKQYYLHNFLKEQPDLNFHSPSLQAELLNMMEFWLKRGVKGFRMDACNFYFHDTELRDNPAHDHINNPQDHVPDINPYGMQQHMYDQSRPETVEFLKRCRSLMNQYGATTSIAELGALDAYSLMNEYTATGDALHMAYGFHFLNDNFGADYIHKIVNKMESSIGEGWPCWAFSNHDAARPVTRWKAEAGSEDNFAKMLITLLTSLRGSICIYQGDELGLPEADLAFEDIFDPYGLEFWPEFKGRDGCRTPMPWQAQQNHGGFTEAEKPWLPVPDEHRMRAVSEQENDETSVLNHYRNFFAWRKEQPALLNGEIELLNLGAPLLGFIRKSDTQNLLCVFNLGAQSQSLDLSAYENAKPLAEQPFASKGDNIAGYSALFFTV